MSAKKISGTVQTWESRELGADEAHVRKAPAELTKEIEDSLGLQMISIRLNTELIDSFKMLASYHGIGYQPLMRDALHRFAESEMKNIVRGVVESQKNYQPRAKAKKAA